MKNKKPKKQEATNYQKLLERFDGSIEADDTQEPVEVKQRFVFDREVLNQNLTVFSIAKVGTREYQGKTISDYDMRVKVEGCDDNIIVRTNHVYVARIIELLQLNGRPIKCNIFKADNGKYYITGWQTTITGQGNNGDDTPF